jgi:hypothetical protein
VWTLAAAFVVLATRTLAYALAPRPTLLSLELQQQAGGPHLVVVGLVAVAVCAALAGALLWLAAVAVKERHALAPDRAPPPRLPLLRVLARALALWLVTSVSFASLESYIHWREGLGFHGLHCLIGPVHRDALPILAALSFLTAAALGGLAHVLSWLRRAIVLLGALRPAAGVWGAPVTGGPGLSPPRRLTPAALRARGPPSAV